MMTKTCLSNKKQKLEEFKQLIIELGKHKKIQKEMLSRLALFDEDIIIEGNTISAFATDREDSFIIEINGNHLQYKSQWASDVVEIDIVRDENKTMITRMECDSTTYENVLYGKKNRHYNSRNIKTLKEIHVYNQQERETFQYIEERHDNYFINKETGEVILHEPDVFENYVEKKYRFRDQDGYIIQRVKKEYIHPEASPRGENTDQYFIGADINLKGNEMPFGGHFYGFDASVYKEYKQGKCDIEKVWDSGPKRLMKSHFVEVWI